MYFITHACVNMITLLLHECDTVEPACILWTPWDQQKGVRSLRCPDFPGHFMPFGTSTKCVDYASVLVFKCPH